MKTAESPSSERVKPLDHVIVNAGHIFVSAHIEKILIPGKAGPLRYPGRWAAQYRVDKPSSDALTDEHANIIKVEKRLDDKKRAYHWSDGTRRMRFDGPRLYVPQIFADEHFVALHGFAAAFGGGCSIKDELQHRIITSVHMPTDYTAAAVVGLLTLDERMGPPPPLQH